MFTGLVEEIGNVAAVGAEGDHFNLSVRAETVLLDVNEGDSIAINGVCLTVTGFSTEEFTVGLAPETLNKTNLGALSAGDPVNLERALLPTTRLGGHFVQGHVDGIGVVESVRPDRDALWITIQTGPELMKYIVNKGFIAVDGTSLTVVDTGTDWFNFTLIDYSQSKAILSKKAAGDTVNLETDILAKYAERLISPAAAVSKLQKEGAQ